MGSDPIKFKENRMKRMTAMLLALGLLSVALTGCQGGATTPKTEALAEVTVGSDTYPPFVYMDENGDPTGIDVEIAYEAFRRMGYEAVFTPINWEQKDALLASGEIDCVWGCYSMSERESRYQWAGPYMVSRQVVAVNADSGISDFAGLAGKTIAVQSTGKPEEILLGKQLPDMPALEDVLSIEDRSVQYASLDCGYVDAIAAHETAILQYMEDFDAHFRILPEPLLVTGIGVAFSLTDQRGLAQQLDDTLAEMRADGTMKEIVGRYLENPDSYLEVDGLDG